MLALMTDGQQCGHEREEARRRAALESLERMRHEGDDLGSAFARAARRAANHFTAKDAVGTDGATDPAELWGRRIGRALSLVAFVGLCIYLYATYLR
jgi:hypothetical protein